MIKKRINKNLLESFESCDSVDSECKKECALPSNSSFNCDDITDCAVILALQAEDINLQDQIDNIPSGGSGSQIKNTFVAGENLGGQRVVMISAGEAFYFDPTDENNVGKQLGITTGAAITGANIDVVSSGVMVSGGWGLIPDSIYYIGANGIITTTIPTLGIDFRVGVAIDAITLQLEFSEQVILI